MLAVPPAAELEVDAEDWVAVTVVVAVAGAGAGVDELELPELPQPASASAALPASAAAIADGLPRRCVGLKETECGMQTGTRNRGFASMDREKQREIARKGGRAAHEKGTAHEFTRDEARAAGRKGGERVSADRDHMSRIGRLGGKNSAGRRQTVTNTDVSSDQPGHGGNGHGAHQEPMPVERPVHTEAGVDVGEAE